MDERSYDQKLQIRTTGLREWRNESSEFNRYEATPYVALDELFKKYTLKDTDCVVDFGCGRGRVAFYIHNRFHIPVTGVEVNDQTIDEAFKNKASYRMKAAHIDAPIQFEFGFAEQYDIKDTDNCFYFFNPFSTNTFKKVVHNIVQSVKAHERSVDIILYYPLPSFTHYLQSGTPFTIVDKIRVPKAKDNREKFIIYRWTP